MARKPSPPGQEMRTEYIAARCTKSHQDRVKRAAKAQGRTVSDWLHDLSLKAVEAAEAKRRA